MDIFSLNIEKETSDNNNYRKVIYTTCGMQLVLMSINPGDEIGMEVHEYIDQFFRIEKGQLCAIVGDKNIELGDGSILIVPRGTKHNIKNNGTEVAKLYSIYTPPNHPKDTIHATKPIEEHDHHAGGYYKKYLKYKSKYLKNKKFF
jgi:mannose-6-phosphate isomerase-like protein (cupin superfamily)